MRVVLLLTLLVAESLVIIIRTEQLLPSLWEKAPSSIVEYPLTYNCSTNFNNTNTPCHLIDPWNYLNRLGIYKILISSASTIMPFCSSSNVSNILFGLASQFGWQYDSNRLFTNGSYQISNDSWWASVNYYLSVIPFLAAVDIGLIRQNSFRIVQRGAFCSDSDQCNRQVPEAMNKWRLFFTNISQPNFCPTAELDEKAIDHCYLGPMWSAHMASIESALPLVNSTLALLPSHNEQFFGLGWANLVGMVAMSRENTNLTNVNQYQREFLPRRILTDDDHPPHCPDLPVTVNRWLELLFSIPIDLYPTLKNIWKDATCNYAARRDSQLVMQTVVLSMPRAIEYFTEALAKSTIFPCDQ